MAIKGVNKVILLGRLGNDPEMKHTHGGQAIANITLATSEAWKDKNTGQMQEKTEWHRIVIFGKLAEIAGQYLKKGSQAYFEGKLQTRKWQDQSGQDRYSTEVVIDINGQMQMLGNAQPQAQQQNNQPHQSSNDQANQPQGRAQESIEQIDSDIPF